MSAIDDEILTIDRAIYRNIDMLKNNERGLLSQNLLGLLRNFVEYISLKIYSRGQDIEINHENIKFAIRDIKAQGGLIFLYKLHRFLQVSASHYTLDEESSERLMLKYYEYLLRIKSYLKNIYNLEVLSNLNLFPIDNDSVLDEYYRKIAIKINEPELGRLKSGYNEKDRYYVQKTKPFFVENEIFYEVTFTSASDKSSKFDRIIAFTKLDISHNYSVRFSVSNDNIQILGKDMPIQIIDRWQVSIRPGEINNFSKILGIRSKIQIRNSDYDPLMLFLTRSGLNLAEVIELSDSHYESLKARIIRESKAYYLFNMLDNCRKLIKSNKPGCNVIKYLLYTFLIGRLKLGHKIMFNLLTLCHYVNSSKNMD